MNSATYKLVAKLDAEPCRVWINQPSTQQGFHKYHGMNVLTMPKVIYAKNGEFIRIYFTSGSVVSMNIPVSALSEGWSSHSINDFT